jgi:hypothetical protein
VGHDLKLFVTFLAGKQGKRHSVPYTFTQNPNTTSAIKFNRENSPNEKRATHVAAQQQ